MINQKAPLNLFRFALATITINITNDINRRLRGSRKKLNIFEKIKNKQSALCNIFIGKLFKSLKSFEKGRSVAGQYLCQKKTS